MRPVRFDRAAAQEQALGDLLVGVTERHQAEDLGLPLAELVRRALAGVPRELDPELWVEVGRAGRDLADGPDQLTLRGLFQEVAARPLA